jgi:hypothetical protein
VRKTRKQNANARNFAKFRVSGMVAAICALMESDIMMPREKDVLVKVYGIIEACLLPDWDRQTPFAITRAGITQGLKPRG